MRILPIVTILLLLYYFYVLQTSDAPVEYFIETCRAGTRLRAFKKHIGSTWDSQGIATMFDSVDLETPFGDPVEYISVKTTTKEYFKEQYLHANKPCVIQDVPNEWIAMKTWSFENFKNRFGKCKFKVTGKNCSLKYDYYHHYVNSPRHRQDDEPIFIFDSSFADKGKKMRELLDEYTIPEWFDEDLFDCLSEEERPNFRWLLVSTRGAGTSLHVDPVCTSAWNTMIQGKKRWILFPPETFTCVNSEIRGAEWFLKEYPKYKHLPHKDIIQNPGETVFLPSDWWHITVNFKDSIAITQNVLSRNNFNKSRERLYEALPKVYLKWIHKLKEDDDTIYEHRTLDSIEYSSDYIESESDVE